MKKTIKFKNGERYVLHTSNKGDILVFDSVVTDEIAFGENNRNDWEKSSLKKWLENWWEENAPEELKAEYDITIPSLANVYSEDELKHYSWDYISAKVDLRKGEKQWDYFKNPRNRVAFIKGQEYRGGSFWWIKTAFRGVANLVYDVHPSGAYYYSNANNSLAVVPACVRKIKCDSTIKQ